MAARFGGEEFALILTGVDRAQALATCERVRVAVANEPWNQVHPDLHVTVSIGLVHEDEANTAGRSPGLLATADARLYAAKRGGRNRVVGYDGAPPLAPFASVGAAALP
jgi:diguanylate cyclase (GGDEF)-like protein